MNKTMLAHLKNAVKNNNLKYTKQREEVFDIICTSKKHLDTQEIYQQIKITYPDSTTSIATVYKSLVFLEDAELISSISIGNKNKKFEVSFKDHHDHLMCISCNKIVEFLDDTIEERQKVIAEKNNFKLTSHSMYLYGLCGKCKKEA